MSMERVRAPAVAGMFYPGDARALRAMVEGLLEQAPPVREEPLAVIAPHAGFIYSGLTAAHAYKGIARGSATAPRRVFLIGPSHRVWLEGASVGNYDAYVTPLGRVPVDREGVECLAARPDVSRDEAPHRLEHSLETQLPFLQVTLVNFRIVPIVYGEMSGGHLADLLEQCWRPGDLIVISTDLSHYHPYAEAKQRDARSNAAILAGDPRKLDGCEACGNTGVWALLETARRQRWRLVLADLRNSGDTAGDRQRVVGYASYLFYPERAARSSVEPGVAPAPPEVGLPELVRTHLESVLSGGSGLEAADLRARWAHLAQPGACFVTLTQRGALRGCIGSLVAHRSLAEDLLENGLSAATRDPRFAPVCSSDLAGLEIEVSLLSPPEPFPHQDGADLIRRLQPGVHGVILAKHGRRATFLPQVWEQLPDPVQFLSHLCRKAGLDGECWRQGAQIQVYTVEKRLEQRSSR
ncbi:MAG: AmmeMemoRadiSam system protein B [Magnetococcales bacterium]|nr:AmmeMemoRadiSam system protein B [Magnetococcales bacterium]NGZ06030.1 AmmeMemoRadiSam system protein B [Magnetococcales bacterium]